MADNTEINNVQDFASNVDDTVRFWKLLINKQITRFNSTIPYKVVNKETGDFEYKTYEIGKVHSINIHRESTSELVSIDVDYGDFIPDSDCKKGLKLIVSYPKISFVKQFKLIIPSIKLNEIFEIKKSKLLKELNHLFEQSLFKEADKLYQSEMTEYLLDQEYQKQKDKFFIVKKTYLIESINKILEKESVHKADAFYASNCKEYFLEDEYLIIKNKFIQKDKEKSLLFLDALLKGFFFLEADKYYRQKSKEYISSQDYDNYKQSFIIEKQKSLNIELDLLLSEFKFKEAYKLYTSEFKNLVPQIEYDLRKELILEKIQTPLFQEIKKLLNEHLFDESDNFYQAQCKEYIPITEYESIKQPISEKLRVNLLQKLENILSSFYFDKADKFYQSNCYKYISNLDYQQRKKFFWDKKRNLLFADIDSFFKDDFLSVDEFHNLKCQPYISKFEYNRIKSNFCQAWVEQNLNNKPDLEQSAAIGAVNSHVQVVARAGSGKTSTLVNRALFLQKHCGIHPSAILLLAFNRKAANEIKERIQKHSGADIPHVMTFHALANRLVHPEEKINFDEKDGEQSLSLSMQAVISEYLDKPVYYAEIRNLMRKHFRIDSESLIAYVKYRRSLPKEGIDGRYYKSRGEKIIADFLFEHDIPYTYEKSFRWQGTNYRPDFTIERPTLFSDNGLVIEYFGLQGDPEYDEMSEAKREYWQNRRDWAFLELDPQVLTTQGRKTFEDHLKNFLQDYFGIACNRLSEEQIWLKIKERAINRFTKAVVSFVQRTRQLCLTADQLSHKIDTYPLDNSEIENIEAQFLILVQDFYKSYLERIEQVGEEDFNGLMQRAAITINDGMTQFKGRSGQGDLKSLKYIMIDEYQDFSLLFSNLIQAIRNQNPQALFFCVGDDWQAINGFAGSDLHYYNNFASIFNPSQKLNIATNYRSRAKIVEIGNKLMQGCGVTSVAHNRQSGIIDLIDLSKFKPLPIEQERHRSDLLTPAVLRLANKFIQENKEVVLLSRKNNLSGNIITDSDGDMISSIVDFRKNIIDRLGLPEHLQHLLTISTAHQYKGKEGQIVIILDIQSYPLIHPDCGYSLEFLVIASIRLLTMTGVCFMFHSLVPKNIYSSSLTIYVNLNLQRS